MHWCIHSFGRARLVVEVHDDLAEVEELVERHWLGEEIGGVDGGADEWHYELTVFDHVAHVEVAAFDVLRASVELGVVGEIVETSRGGRVFRSFLIHCRAVWCVPTLSGSEAIEGL